MDNTIVDKGKEYYLEKIWRNNKTDKQIDNNGKLYPFPKEGSEIDWPGKEQFVTRLKFVEKILKNINKYKLYKNPKNCILKKSHNTVSKGYFVYQGVIWEDGLLPVSYTHLTLPTTR